MAQKDAKKNAQTQSTQKNPLTILIAVLIVVVVGTIAFFVYRNNQASKATHEEYAATQEDYEKAENAYKDASQKLSNTADECKKSYESYKLCPALTKSFKEVEDEYAAVKTEVDGTKSDAVDEMKEASAVLKSSIATLQDLERKANDAVANYEKSLLKAVQDEHSTLLTEAHTNLKEAKALSSVSEGKTSDEELWEAFSRVLDVYGKELNKQAEVKSENPDDVIASNKILTIENDAILSATQHLKSIYKQNSDKSD